MDQSTQKVVMDALDSRINIELVVEQERKWMDALIVASVPARERTQYSLRLWYVYHIWIIGCGYILQIEDHCYHEGELVLVNCWNRNFCQSNHHWPCMAMNFRMCTMQ